jgi:hypothetical protein
MTPRESTIGIVLVAQVSFLGRFLCRIFIVSCVVFSDYPSDRRKK